MIRQGPTPGLEPRTRETLEVGDEGRFTKRITERDVLAFAGASGDFNPIHIDEAYARKSIFERRVVHGVLTAGMISTVLGSDIPGLGTIFLELQISFTRPVFFDDTITAKAMVTEIVNPKRVRLFVACTNQDGRDVALGNALVLPPQQTRLLGWSEHATSRRPA